MTGQQLVNEINDIVDNTLGDDMAITLINFVKNLVEDGRQWIFLVKEDSSKSVSPSDTFLTSKALPSDFNVDLSLFVGLDSDESYLQYRPVPFAKRRMFRNTRGYYIDWVNSLYFLTGQEDVTKTIFLTYIYQTDDLTLLNSPVWPSRFHKIISFLAADIWSAGIDVDDITLRQALKLSTEGEKLLQSMIDWDAQIRLRAINGQAGFRSHDFGSMNDRVIDSALNNNNRGFGNF